MIESHKVQGEEANQMKRKVFDIYEKALGEFDQIRSMKDANGAKMKLKPIEINQKCSLLITLSKMSKDMDIINMPSTLGQDDNDRDAKLDPKMKSEIKQLYYMLRAEETYKSDANDAGMAERYRSECDAIRQDISEEAQERADTKFINFLEDEESIAMAQQRAAVKKENKKTVDTNTSSLNGAEKSENVKSLKNMEPEKEA